MTAGPWIGLRRKLMKKAKRHHRKRKMKWIGGILYFSDNLKPVPCIRKVPKPNRRAIGIRAIQ